MSEIGGEIPIGGIFEAPRNVEQIKPVDVRDYFRITAFQKKAESIDPDKSHPWSQVESEGILAENNYGTILAGETYDSLDQESKHGLLIFEKTATGETSSVFTKNLTQDQRLATLAAIHTFAPYLPDEQRHQYIRKVIQEIPNIQNNDSVEEKLATMALEIIPDFPNGNPPQEIFSWDEFPSKPPSSKEAQFRSLLNLAGRKMPKEKFEQRLERLKTDLRFTDDPFGRNYGPIVKEIGEWAFMDREDLPRDHELLKGIKPLEYQIKDKITRPVRSLEELETILRSMPVERMPETKTGPVSKEEAKMVSLDNVVGGVMENWTVSTSEGRGIPKIFEFTQRFQDGSLNLAGRSDPIKVIEIERKYFVDMDGRHRAAALKALGVKEAPMLVRHSK